MNWIYYMSVMQNTHGSGLIAENIVKGIPDTLNRLKNGKFLK